MRLAPAWEMPPEKARIRKRAERLEWFTIGYLITVGIVLYFALGSSQAMQAAWLEDLFSMIPPVVFLVGSHFSTKAPNKRYPYGYHRATTVAFLAASSALVVLAIWLIIDAGTKLLSMQHPTIGSVDVFGQTVWLGWIMLAALAYSGIPPLVIGRLQMRYGRSIHDKVLYADGKMRKADWLTSGSASLGVIGIGLGFWWADSVAALIIALDILHDGWTELRLAVADIMEREPTSVSGEPLDVPGKIADHLKSRDWIADAEVRLREHGHLLFGEAFIVPAEGGGRLADKMHVAADEVRTLDWRIGEIVISLLPERERGSRAG